MKWVLSRLRNAVAAASLLLVAGGCASVHELAERSQISRHPIHERRMTNQSAPGYVPTGVWRVKGSQNTVYVAGTCHIVSDKEIPFPSSFYAAYNDSKILYVEVDSLSFSAKWMLARALPGVVRWTTAHAAEFTHRDGRTLQDDLSPETIRKLRSHFGDSYSKFQHMTPLGLLFFGQFLNPDGQQGAGVDDVFTALAHRDFKPVRALDDSTAADLAMPTLEAMLADLKRQIAERGADAVVCEQLLEPDEDESDWRRGDEEASEKVHAEINRVSPSLFQSLLPERNRKWMPKIDQALRGKRNAMILVGAAHMGGREGVLQLLRDAGYEPERMYGVDRP